MMDVYFSQAETPNELVSTRDVEFIGCQLLFFFPEQFFGSSFCLPNFPEDGEALLGIPMPTIAMQMC